jgi:hypothetical protein
MQMQKPQLRLIRSLLKSVLNNTCVHSNTRIDRYVINFALASRLTVICTAPPVLNSSCNFLVEKISPAGPPKRTNCTF